MLQKVVNASIRANFWRPLSIILLTALFSSPANSRLLVSTLFPAPIIIMALFPSPANSLLLSSVLFLAATTVFDFRLQKPPKAEIDDEYAPPLRT
jgi:hypothetical protein